jgi:tRNA threonylcarbamoyladenosine biosynthesis protein TsaB
MLTLALDTATPRSSCALIADGELIGEREARAVNVLAEVDALLTAGRFEPSHLGRIAIGIGPGSFTGIRIGLAAARGLALALGIPLAGVSTLDALAAGAPGALPVIDASRREVFTINDGKPAVISPELLEIEAGRVYVGDGACRYRELLVARGAEIPPDESDLHHVRARFHAALAREYGPAELVEPLYLRVPDAERTGRP